VRWSEPDAKTNLQTVQAQNWYVYSSDAGWSDEAFRKNKRLFGAKEVYFFYIHINRAGGPTHDIPQNVNEYVPNYTVTESKKLSANLEHLLALAGAYAGGSTGGSKPVPHAPDKLDSIFRTERAKYDSEFGGGLIYMKYRPSDLTFHRVAVTTAVGPLRNLAAPGPTQNIDLGSDQVFDNEGKYFFDFSIAIPVKKITQVQFNNTTATATPVSVDGTNVFMVGNLYLPPNDVKTNNWVWIPHALGGVAFAKQPMHKLLLAAGWGPKFSEVYLGALWVKQARTAVGSNSCNTPAVGSTVDGSAGYHFCPQFTIGINLPITAISTKLGAPK
jgi:hypothetical protein